MQLPKYNISNNNERIGINALHKYACDNSQIWREVTLSDIGIDGHLEYVTPEGSVTGRTLGIQVKSGPSYFKTKSINGWKFYPENKHRNYWESYPLPVILVLHDIQTDLSYWEDVRQLLRTDSDTPYIEVPQNNILQNTEPVQLFTTTGIQDAPFLNSLEDILNILITTNTENSSFPLSYFDLFAQGLTNTCRSLYFGMDLAITAAEFNQSEEQSEFGIGIGQPEDHFLFNYIKFLLSQNLAYIDFSDCLLDWDRGLHPHFVAPLSSRGRDLVKLIHEKENFFVKENYLPNSDYLHIAQEGLFKMEPLSYLPRLSRISQFQSIFLSVDNLKKH